ncbi:unnamed protein product [Allacma fusca]|uniref:Uncharacterized protein n=1 Tax=Allacma fusca TaxID=39272 RepID=A0A8J2LDM2_9HEXA|nr:unnamed protein product [Allacma fusca]
MTDQPQRIELGNNVFLRFEEQRKKNSQTQTCRITEPFPVLNANDIDYGTFYEQFLITNRPCLFISSLTDDWNCRNDWIDKTEVFPRINFDFLERTYGKSNVGVVDCERFTPEFTPQQTYNMNKDSENCMPLTEFISYWKDYINNGYPDSMKLQYLKVDKFCGSGL